MSSAICFNLDQSKILSSGNGLKNNINLSSGLGFNLVKVNSLTFGKVVTHDSSNLGSMKPVQSSFID